jgi:hypothetical protein
MEPIRKRHRILSLVNVLAFACGSLWASENFVRPLQLANDQTFIVQGFPLVLEPQSDKNFQRAQSIIEAIDYLNFKDLQNCESRAYWMAFELAAENIHGSLIAAFGGNFRNEWDHHVAMLIGKEGEEQPYVFDRAFSKGPMPVEDWLRWLGDDRKLSELWAYPQKTFPLQVINHYCWVKEGEEFHPPIQGFEDPRLSSDTRRVLGKLNKLEKITSFENEQFDCTDQGLEF